jgi:hypothetical protein
MRPGVAEARSARSRKAAVTLAERRQQARPRSVAGPAIPEGPSTAQASQNDVVGGPDTPRELLDALAADEASRPPVRIGCDCPAGCRASAVVEAEPGTPRQAHALPEGWAHDGVGGVRCPGCAAGCGWAA